MIRGVTPGEQGFGGDVMVDGSNGSQGYAWNVNNNTSDTNDFDPHSTCHLAGNGQGCVRLLVPALASFSSGELAARPLTFGYDWHTYRIEVKNNNVRIVIDGKMVINVTEYRYWSGGSVDLHSAKTQIAVSSFKIIAL